MNISIDAQKSRREMRRLFCWARSVRFVYFEKSTFGATLFSGLPLKYSSR
jgi:hypothetical protein